MSELNNCCGTTCDKQAAIAERDALVAQLTALKTAAKPIVDGYFDWLERNQVDVEDCNQLDQQLYAEMVELNNCCGGKP
jgi:hypothetical protein